MTKLETLDNLVKVCVDSAERYRRAAADVGKEKLVQFFDAQQAARRRDADELNLERKRMGAEGEQSGKESGSVAGFIDRTEMDVNVVMSMGDTGVVQWCLEDARDVIAEYQKALRMDFSATTRSALERQLSANQPTLAALERVPEALRPPALLTTGLTPAGLKALPHQPETVADLFDEGFRLLEGGEVSALR